jgi:hypothetical protein
MIAGSLPFWSKDIFHKYGAKVPINMVSSVRLLAGAPPV